MKKELSIDDLFKEQSVESFLFTVEPQQEASEVKLTPWKKNSGCLCHLSFIIKKDLVDKVITSGETHYCCNKKLHVVEVVFHKGSSIELSNLFQQVFSKMSAPDHHSHNENIQQRPFNAGTSLNYNKAVPYQKIQHSSNTEGNDQNNFSCGGYPCPPGNDCVGCGGYFHCVPKGSYCCSGNICPPGTSCMGCGGYFQCAQPGSTCCSGHICPPGHHCIGCGGYFHCVPNNCYCEFGQIKCN